MVNSMTGFAALKGANGDVRWNWELRSVNARGLDIRLRLPEGCDAIEPVLRKKLGARLSRGSVSLGLRLHRQAAAQTNALSEANLAATLTALAQIETAAGRTGQPLRPSSAAEILALKGIWEGAEPSEDDTTALIQALKQDIDGLIDAFTESRRDEGRALDGILGGQLDQIDALLIKASEAANARSKTTAQTLRDNLANVLDNSEGVDPARLAQELAIIAVKTDVAEELDRLNAHVKAARKLLETKGTVGRKFDFLMQEFNREANTLCSKSQSTDLTGIGLSLKTVIDQMREQVQNVE